MSKSNWIKKGMIVVSMTNLDIPMTVEDFIYKSGNVLDEQQKEVKKKFLVGIQCYRFETETSQRVHERFHSRELIPYEVAQKGVNEAFKFYNREGEYKEM